MMLRIFVFLGLCGLVHAEPARACSVSPDYVRPTNFELVQLAEAIVIVTAEAQSGEAEESTITFRVDSVIKGAAPDRVQLGGILGPAFGNPGPSDLENLSGSHPEGHAGPCNRMSFARGGQYILFLVRESDGGWRQLDYPFSRVNEDYAGEDNAWIRTVRRYASIQRDLGPMEELAVLRTMIESGRDRSGQPLRAPEIADMRDHFRSLSPFKPTEFLLEAYARLERGQPLEYGVRPDDANRENSGIDEAVRALLGEESPSAGIGGVEGLRLAVLEALVRGRHPDALPLFERLAGAPGADARMQGLLLRFLAGNGQYPRAYRWIETELPAALLRLDAEDAIRLLDDVAQVQRGDDWTEGRERWRSDPGAAANWPELAFALHRFRRNLPRGEEVSMFMDAIKEIPIADYRARPELTLALAAAFDEGVDDWALAEVARETASPPSAPVDVDGGETRYGWRDDPDLLPIRVLVVAWVSEREPVLERILCQGGTRRALLIRALGMWGDPLYGGLLWRVAATPGLTEDERSLLIRAETAMTARELQSGWGAVPADENAWLLSRLLSREAAGATPLRCT